MLYHLCSSIVTAGHTAVDRSRIVHNSVSPMSSKVQNLSNYGVKLTTSHIGKSQFSPKSVISGRTLKRASSSSGSPLMNSGTCIQIYTIHSREDVFPPYLSPSPCSCDTYVNAGDGGDVMLTTTMMMVMMMSVTLMTTVMSRCPWTVCYQLTMPTQWKGCFTSLFSLH